MKQGMADLVTEAGVSLDELRLGCSEEWTLATDPQTHHEVDEVDEGLHTTLYKYFYIVYGSFILKTLIVQSS